MYAFYVRACISSFQVQTTLLKTSLWTPCEIWRIFVMIYFDYFFFILKSYFFRRFFPQIVPLLVNYLIFCRQENKPTLVWYIKLPFTRKRTILFASFDLVLTFLWYGCKALLAFPDLETISLVISTFQPLLGCYICISGTIHISSFHPFSKKCYLLD